MVTVEEYLNTSYSPDCDYVDGTVVDRNSGEREHSRMQFLLAAYLGARERQWGIVGFTELRAQITPTRFRISDLCVTIEPDPQPFLCIEILSRDDRFGAMQEKIEDYVNFGVKYVWVIDPQTRKAHIFHASGVVEAKDGILFTTDPDIRVPLHEI